MKKNDFELLFMNEVEEIAKVGQYLWNKGWAESNGGNISINISDKFNDSYKYFLVTATGSRFRDISDFPEDNLVLMRLLSSEEISYQLCWGNQEPTSEFITHHLIHEYLEKNKRPEKAVIHTHPQNIIAATHTTLNNESKLNNILWSTHPEMKLFIPEGVSIAPYRVTGSKELAMETVKSLNPEKRVVVWEKHGCLAVGKDISEAFDLIDMVNKSLEIYMLAKNMDDKFEGIDKESISKLGKIDF